MNITRTVAHINPLSAMHVVAAYAFYFSWGRPYTDLFPQYWRTYGDTLSPLDWTKALQSTFCKLFLNEMLCHIKAMKNQGATYWMSTNIMQMNAVITFRVMSHDREKHGGNNSVVLIAAACQVVSYVQTRGWALTQHSAQSCIHNTKTHMEVISRFILCRVSWVPHAGAKALSHSFKAGFGQIKCT